MNRIFSLGLGFLLASSLIGCKVLVKESRPYRVQLLSYDENGNAQFEIKTLETLENLRTVDSPEIKVRIDSAMGNGYVQDRIPEALYRVRSDGVILPLDTDAFLYYGLYWNMEVLSKFDRLVGAYDLLPRPRVSTIYTRKMRGQGGEAFENNLFYSPSHDRIGIVKFQDSKIPAALNLGLIAHEHFHALFNAITRPTSFYQDIQAEVDFIRHKNSRDILEYQSLQMDRRIFRGDRNAWMPSAENSGRDQGSLHLLEASADSEGETALSAEELAELEAENAYRERVAQQNIRREALVNKLQSEFNSPSAKIHNFHMLNSLSEGWADFWAWLVTGQENYTDPTFKGVEVLKNYNFDYRSVISKKQTMALPERVSLMFFSHGIKFATQSASELIFDKGVKSFYYTYGSYFTKLMRTLADEMTAGLDDDVEKKKVLGAWVIQSAKNLRHQLDQFQRKDVYQDYLGLDQIVSALWPSQLEVSSESKENMCEIIKEFLGMSEQSRDSNYDHAPADLPKDCGGTL